MKFFFSYLLLFGISFLHLWISQGQGWWLFIIVLLIIVFHYRKIFTSFHLTTLILGILLLCGIFLHLSLKNSNQNQNQNLYSANEPILLRVVEKYKNSLIVKDLTHGNNIFLTDNILSEEEKINLYSGDKLTACLNIKLIEKTNLNAFNYFLKSKYVNYKAYINQKCSITWEFAQSWYRKIIQYFSRFSSNKFERWVLFLLFQINDENIYENYKKMSEIGIVHLFVISGFHLLILGKFWFWVAKLKKQKIWNFVFYAIGLFFVFGLAYLTNWKLSSVKALILLLLYLFRNQNIKSYWNLNSAEQIGILGLIFLLWNPFMFYQISYQFSFLASWALSIKIKKFQNKKQQKLKFLLWMWLKNIIVIAFIFPILINLNYRISIWFFVLSILYTFISLIFYPLFFIFIWFPFLKNWWIWIFGILEQSFQFWIKYGFFVVFGEWKPFWIVFYYSVIIILFYFFHKTLPQKWLLILWVVSFLSIFAQLHFAHPYFRLHMINVGHGMAMLLQTPNQKTNILFDAGVGKESVNNTTIISNYLKKMRVNKIDVLFLSHQHSDHTNNLWHLQNNFLIDQIITNQNQKPYYQINKMKFYNLAYDYYQFMKKENNQSLVLQFRLQNYNVLLTFDAEAQAEFKLIENINLREIDIWQVGHHGSLTSSIYNFRQKIKPKYCLISNRWKSLFEEILTREKCRVYSTRTDGNIQINLNLGGLKINKEKNNWVKYNFI